MLTLGDRRWMDGLDPDLIAGSLCYAAALKDNTLIAAIFAQPPRCTNGLRHASKTEDSLSKTTDDMLETTDHLKIRDLWLKTLDLR